MENETEVLTELATEIAVVSANQFDKVIGLIKAEPIAVAVLAVVGTLGAVKLVKKQLNKKVVVSEEAGV